MISLHSLISSLRSAYAKTPTRSKKEACHRLFIEQLEDRRVPVRGGSIGGLIGGSVFHDINGDSARQASEPAQQGWGVQLLSSGGALLQQDTTDSAGVYSFADLANG